MFPFKSGDEWVLAPMLIQEFLIGMSELGIPQEIQMVGTFGAKADEDVRTAHRDVNLPMHRDGIYTQAIADMQKGTYVEKPNVDIVGLYCVREDEPCYTILSPDGVKVLAEINLRAGDALIWDNKLWHGRRGPVGKRLLIRFWTSLPK